MLEVLNDIEFINGSYVCDVDLHYNPNLPHDFEYNRVMFDEKANVVCFKVDSPNDLVTIMKIVKILAKSYEINQLEDRTNVTKVKFR